MSQRRFAGCSCPRRWGIWKQRIRWAQGGQEVILRHWKVILDVRHRRIWPIYYEQWLSLFWSYSWVFDDGYHLFVATSLKQMLIWLTFTSFALSCCRWCSSCSRFPSIINTTMYANIFFYGAWYPSLYWVLNAIIVMFALPKAIRSRIKGGDAVWTSPDRGNRK